MRYIMNLTKNLNKLLLIGTVLSGIKINAEPFIVAEITTTPETKTNLKYVDSTTFAPVTLDHVLKEYKYSGSELPQTSTDLEPYLRQYNQSNEYFLLCDSRFLDPIKSTIWKIKFSLINDGIYPDGIINKLKTFCNLIISQELRFKNFLIKVLFQQNGLRNLYAEIKDLHLSFSKDLFLNKFRTDFNDMLDIVDPDEEIERFKR